MSQVDIAQTRKYKEMLGLTNIYSTTVNTKFVASVSILGNLYISQTSILGQNHTTNNTLYISGYTVLNNNVTLNNSLYCNDSILLHNTTLLSSLQSNNINISNTSIITGSEITDLSNIYNYNSNNILISSTTTFNSNLQCNNIIGLYTSINILGDNIYLGNTNSNITLNGIQQHVNINEVKVIDKIIYLNNTSLSTVQNDGSLCGIEIYTTSGYGFIKTSNDGMRYQIKAPLDNDIKYICTVDYDNNLSVSGTTILYGPSTIFSSLTVDGNTILKGNTIFNSSLLTSGNTILQNSVSLLSNIVISGNTIFQKDTTLMSELYVGGKASLNGITTINSTLSINGNTNIIGSTTIRSDFNVYGNTLLQGKTTLLSELYISGKTIIQGTTSVVSDLNILNKSDILGSTTIKSNVNIYDTLLLQGSSTMNSNLHIIGNTVIDGNMIINSTNSVVNSLNILSQVICQVPHYDTNKEAVLNGVPLWGFYRTGGILKIRLDDIAPSMYLVGNSTISIPLYSNYIEQGVISNDNVDNTLDSYIISISNNVIFNIISVPILISPNLTITQTSTLPLGSYVIEYSSTDNAGNKAQPLYRNLNIINIV